MAVRGAHGVGVVAFPRLHLFELEDLPWFPSAIRDLGTDYIQFMSSRLGLQRPMVEPLERTLRVTQETRILDLCSGGGGPLLDLVDVLNARGVEVRATLTDRFPNLPAFRAAAERSGGAISYLAEPVDVLAVPRDLGGLRTMFNAFHHFRPRDAGAILADAVAAGQPIAVFEIPQRSLVHLLTFLVTPLVVAVATPFIRPFRWGRLLWTYLIPIVPIYCLWDGLVSHLRAYEPDELATFAHEVGTDNYDWDVDRQAIPSTHGSVTHLIGIPRLVGTPS